MHNRNIDNSSVASFFLFYEIGPFWIWHARNSRIHIAHVGEVSPYGSLAQKRMSKRPFPISIINKSRKENTRNTPSKVSLSNRGRAETSIYKIADLMVTASSRPSFDLAIQTHDYTARSCFSSHWRCCTGLVAAIVGVVWKLNHREIMERKAGYAERFEKEQDLER